ncbi:MAG: response regulator [Lachnospiraceae bacterium]|nr:response regulator [Lachnospiraceae bacterium]
MAATNTLTDEKTLLIVDDVEINRMILAEIFKDTYHIIDTGSGAEAIDILAHNENISAVLLDLLMPEVNGLDVLREMNRTGRIEETPVFMITAADSEDMLMQSYDLGAIDVINKPFMTQFLRCRVNSVIELYEHRHQLEKIVDKQVARLSELMKSMIEVLASVIEFRDLESGEHVKRVSYLTGVLMKEVSDTYEEYRMPDAEIDKIASSACLHDIGKISIPDQILNKPGRLTAEEFDIMKQHTTKGCEILRKIPDIMDAGVYSYAYDICRHHHEKWDGRGYPDGICGDEISIWAQVTALVDVYDALTSDRVYKKKFDRETALSMIYNGECGAFNPKILKVFESALNKAEKDTGHKR